MSGILAIYMLILSIFPCADIEPCNSGSIAMCTEQLPDKQERTTDYCTPFCICSGCHNIISLTTVPNFEVTYWNAYISKPQAGFIPAIIRDVTIDFFQPPRLG
jgi:hypothetical protein